MGKKGSRTKEKAPASSSSSSSSSSSLSFFSANVVIFALIAALLGRRLLLTFAGEGDAHADVATADAIPSGTRRWPSQCSNQYAADAVTVSGCTPQAGGACDRVVYDDFVSGEEVAVLTAMAERGMAMADRRPEAARAGKKKGGPTILDVNTGYVLASGQHQPMSIYRKGQLYSKAEYALYRDVTRRLKRLVEETFGLSTATFFTAPTFITREVGDAKWSPSTMHDEYWHAHVDKNNTAHYDFSGLVYLSTQGEDFTGGLLHFYPPSSLDCTPFMDPVNPGPCKVVGPHSLEVAPRKGRAIVFGSGQENPHRVTKVASGTRYVLSFWFTCDERREMKAFLDGKMHRTYGAKSEVTSKQRGK